MVFCFINGIFGDSIGDFVGVLGDYSGEFLMCLVVLICFDGLIFLGLDFLGFAVNWIEGFFSLDLEEN